jgi:hypothetical protein
MCRRLFPLAVLAAAVLGCSKKKPDGGDGTDEPALTGPEYTIKLRGDQEGDKMLVTETSDGSFSSTVLVGAQEKKEAKKAVEKFEYTETIFAMPAGADRPTKVARAYTVAEEQEAGKSKKVFSYAGKTVLIEKKNGTYGITADGKPLPPEEDAQFRKSFEKPDKVRNEHFQPKKPVKVGESWAIDIGPLSSLPGGLSVPVNKDTGTARGKLVRVYEKDGKQWGVIDVKIDFKVEGDQGGLTMDGDLGLGATFDMPIDGSSHEGVAKMKMSGKVTGKGKGVNLEFVLDADGTETRTPAK